jgi:hypothetical protein
MKKGRFTVKCLVSGVWCLVSGVWCLVSGVWCLVHFLPLAKTVFYTLFFMFCQVFLENFYYFSPYQHEVLDKNLNLCLYPGT